MTDRTDKEIIAEQAEMIGWLKEGFRELSKDGLISKHTADYFTGDIDPEVFRELMKRTEQ